MHDYMRALRQRFYTPPECEELSRELELVHSQLHERLDRQERKLLLRLIDLVNMIRDEASLHSFISGYRLASGLHQELAGQMPYSFDQEEEDHANAAITQGEE